MREREKRGVRGGKGKKREKGEYREKAEKRGENMMKKGESKKWVKARKERGERLDVRTVKVENWEGTRWIK